MSNIDDAAVLPAGLLSELATARQALGLSQAELAQRVGVSRMTVQRAEAENADINLSTFLALAQGLGLHFHLAPAPDASVEAHPPVHRGLHHNRTRGRSQGRDQDREAALAKAWEAANARNPVGLAPVMDSLVPGYSQAQASASATAVQWLGSMVGFDFLTRALGNAGYEIKDIKKG